MSAGDLGGRRVWCVGTRRVGTSGQGEGGWKEQWPDGLNINERWALGEGREMGIRGGSYARPNAFWAPLGCSCQCFVGVAVRVTTRLRACSISTECSARGTRCLSLAGCKEWMCHTHRIRFARGRNSRGRRLNSPEHVVSRAQQESSVTGCCTARQAQHTGQPCAMARRNDSTCTNSFARLALEVIPRK